MAQYYIVMDNEVFGPYSLDAIQGLGILPDTMICTDSVDSSWKAATLYPELQPFIQDNETNTDSPQTSNDNQSPTGRESVSGNVDINEEEETLHYSPRFSYNEDLLLKYKQKRKSALIGVLTLGLAGLSILGISDTWRNNIFRGTSMDKGGVGFVLRILSFCLLSVLIAIPVFIISVIQLIYYTIKIASLSH